MLNRALEVFLVFLRLGLTSFGGPVAHLGYFHDEFVARRKWLHDHAYADLVALCQFLPGPASSQVGIALGLSRAGYTGALAAWLGFTLPSALLMVLFAYGVSSFSNVISSGALHGLKIAAVAVVAQAIVSMWTKLCPDKVRAGVAIFAAVLVLSFPTAVAQIAAIALAGIFGSIFLRTSEPLPHSPLTTAVNPKTGVRILAVFFAVLLLSPFVTLLTDSSAVRLFDSFFRAGSLVFGGGHVVLPLLKNEVVGSGWVNSDIFLAGYGAAQALPGPLFTFAAYLGAVSQTELLSLPAAALCLAAVFLPSFLLVLGILPFWERLRKYNRMRFAIRAVNAAVVGLLIAAFYNPLWTSGIRNIQDFALLLAAFLLLIFYRLPSWLIVAGCALTGGLLL